MPRGVKNPKRELVIKGRKGSTWEQKAPIHFDLTNNYLWVGKEVAHDGGEWTTWDYCFSMSAADARKLRDFLNENLGRDSAT